MGLEVKCILLFMTVIRSTPNVSLFWAPSYKSSQERGSFPRTGTATLRNWALDLFRWLHLLLLVHYLFCMAPSQQILSNTPKFYMSYIQMETYTNLLLQIS